MSSVTRFDSAPSAIATAMTSVTTITGPYVPLRVADAEGSTDLPMATTDKAPFLPAAQVNAGRPSSAAATTNAYIDMDEHNRQKFITTQRLTLGAVILTCTFIACSLVYALTVARTEGSTDAHSAATCPLPAVGSLPSWGAEGPLRRGVAPGGDPTVEIARLFVSDANRSDVARQVWFPSTLSNASIREHMALFSLEPHMAGSERNTHLANLTAALYRSFGFDDVVLDTYPATISVLASRSVTLFAPGVTTTPLYDCMLDEPNILNSSEYQRALKTSNGYSGNGSARGPMVWANYGRQEDFDTLAALNVSLTGKVVVVRYGDIFRGNKVALAQSYGAVAVLIVMESADVGAAKGQGTLPTAPWATNRTVQRGSIFPGHGDPATPTWPSDVGGPMLSPSQMIDPVVTENLPLATIPVQPLGYGDAAVLLEGLSGVRTFANTPSLSSWSNTAYNILGVGPSTNEVQVTVVRNLTRTTLTNVVATIRGAVEPDRVVMLASHRDAWTYGAVDPISGHSVVLEVGKALGAMKSNYSWRPRRTIQLSSWDGEEFAIIGSIEYVEKHVELLRQRGVAYINLDTAVTGMDGLSLAGSPSFWPLLRQVMQEVPLPVQPSNAWRPTQSTTSAANATTTISTTTTTAPPMSTTGGSVTSTTAAPLTLANLCSQQWLAPLGSGSDFVAFLQLAGVPSMDAGFYANDGRYGAVYHSNYDTLYWMENFGDPQFQFHVAMANFIGRVVLRLAEDTIVPLNVSAYADQVQRWVSDATQLVAMDGGAPAYLRADFAYMDQAVRRLVEQATGYMAGVAALQAVTSTLSQLLSQPATQNVTSLGIGAARSALSSSSPMLVMHMLRSIRETNDVLVGFERVFLGFTRDESGQPWYKHVLFTPSAVNEYGSTVMPLMTDALEAAGAVNRTDLNFAIGRVAQFIKRGAAYLRTSAAVPWGSG